MSYFTKNILRSPTALGVGLLASFSLYGYRQWSEPSIAPLVITESQSFERTGSKHFSFSWNDRGQDLELRQVQDLLVKRLERKAKAQASDIAKHILRMGKQYDISPSLILAVIQEESSYRLGAKSPVGAMGLMQIRPSTAKYVAKLRKISSYKSAKDLRNPMINIQVGVAYLSYLRSRFANPTHYVAAYNLGPTTVGRMLDEQNFALGKVTKYVTEIHDEAQGLRRLPVILAAN